MSFSLHVISWSAKFYLRLFIKTSFYSSACGSKPCHSSHCDSMNFYFLFSVFVLFVSPQPFCETHLLGHSSKHLRNMLSKLNIWANCFCPDSAKTRFFTCLEISFSFPPMIALLGTAMPELFK